MSVIMMLRVAADVDAFESYAEENAEKLTRISEDGRSPGREPPFLRGGRRAGRHRRVAGRGVVPGFFDGQTEIPDVMAAAAKGEPEVTFFRKLETSDHF